MLEDHKQRLIDLSDKLIDVVVDESNPANWSGGNKKISELTAKERGDRFWDKKNAVETLKIVTKVESLISAIERKVAPTTNSGGEDPFDLAQRVASAEKEAEQILARIQAKR